MNLLRPTYALIVSVYTAPFALPTPPPTSPFDDKDILKTQPRITGSFQSKKLKLDEHSHYAPDCDSCDSMEYITLPPRDEGRRKSRVVESLGVLRGNTKRVILKPTGKSIKVASENKIAQLPPDTEVALSSDLAPAFFSSRPCGSATLISPVPSPSSRPSPSRPSPSNLSILERQFPYESSDSSDDELRPQAGGSARSLKTDLENVYTQKLREADRGNSIDIITMLESHDPSIAQNDNP